MISTNSAASLRSSSAPPRSVSAAVVIAEKDAAQATGDVLVSRNPYADFARIAALLRERVDADVIAFQEVSGAQAVRGGDPSGGERGDGDRAVARGLVESHGEAAAGGAAAKKLLPVPGPAGAEAIAISERKRATSSR